MQNIYIFQVYFAYNCMHVEKIYITTSFTQDCRSSFTHYFYRSDCITSQGSERS